MVRLRTHWVITALAALVGALGALLAREYLSKAGPRIAFAEEAGGGVTANYMIAMLGMTVNDATPIVLVDTKAQTLLVYEYMVSTKRAYLRCARTYAFDKDLTERYFFAGNAYNGPSVGDIENLLRSLQRQ